MTDDSLYYRNLMPSDLPDSADMEYEPERCASCEAPLGDVECPDCGECEECECVCEDVP